MDLNEKIAQIGLKVKQMALKMEHLEGLNRKLQEENKELTATVDRAINFIADLEEKLEAAQAALEKKEEKSPKQIKKMRKKLDTSIKELDDCIDWLENE